MPLDLQFIKYEAYKMIKCEVYLSFFATQYSTNTLGIFFDIWRYNTVILDLIVFSGITYILLSQQLSDWCIWIK